VITLKTPDRRKIAVTDLVRDRDLNAQALYRVKTGGYLAFSEPEWVDKIEFKVFDVPVTELAEYRKFARLLVGINQKVSSIKTVLRGYNQLSLRLMNICDKSKFPSLRAMDKNIRNQLSIYKRLILLRSLVVNAMERFIRDRSCADRYDQYGKDLGIFTKKLTNLCKDYDRFKKKALEAAKSVKSESETGKPNPSRAPRSK